MNLLCPFLYWLTKLEFSKAMPGCNNVPYGVIQDALKEGNVVAFLGSAASAVYRPDAEEKWEPGKPFLPFGYELAEDLAEASGFPEDQNVEAAKRELITAIQSGDQELINRATPALHRLLKILQKSDLPLVASYYTNVTGYRRYLNSRLRTVFNVPCHPGKLHRLLASIDHPLLIVTTNYDDMMERALAGRPFHLVVDRGEKGVVWVRNSDGKAGEVKANKLTAELNARDCPIVYKLHGCLDRLSQENDHFLISEEDYVDFLGRGTPWVPPYLWNIMAGKSFLFLGYSLADWNVRVLLRRLREAIPKGIPSWAIARNPGAADEEIWKNHRIMMFDCNLLEFVDRLVQTMEWQDADNE